MGRLLYFIRHGESDANLSRTFSNRDLAHSLTPRGIQQAEALATRLKGERIDALFASPVPRAVETATIVSRALRIDFEVREELREFDVGRFEGTASEEGWREFDDVIAAWQQGESHRSVGGGESLDRLVARFRPLVERLVADPSTGRRIALIGHGGVFHSGLPFLLREPSLAFSWAHPISPTEAVVVEAASPLRCLRWCTWTPPFEEVAQSN